MEKIQGLIRKLKNNSKKSIVMACLTALVTTTAIKDNVHFGSVNLNNPEGNHYTWGLLPTTKIKGDAKGNFYTMGLICGTNDVRDNSKIEGNMSGYGLVFGANMIGNNSKITGNISGYGLIIGGNATGNNFKIKGDMSGYGLILGANRVGNNSRITGNIFSKGIFATTPFETNFGSNSEIGLKDYLIKEEIKK